MKHRAKIIAISLFSILALGIYYYFTDFFTTRGFVVLNESLNRYDFESKGLDMLTSPSILIPVLGAFVIGLCCTGLAQTLAMFTYQSDKDNEIEKYKNIAETAVENAENSIAYEKERLDLLSNEFIEREQAIIEREQANIEKKYQIQLRVSEIDNKIKELNGTQEELTAKNNLLNQKDTEFKEKADNSNSSFRRLQRQKEKHMARIQALEYENAMLKSQSVL